jgi:hypothetical protein
VRSDHDILKNKGLVVHYSPNPHVKDRYNCVNGLLHHGRLGIHPRCKKLIRDLERMTHDNKDPDISHLSDSLGYLCWALAPLQTPRPANRTINF